jgi:hypothetical protein
MRGNRKDLLLLKQAMDNHRKHSITQFYRTFLNVNGIFTIEQANNCIIVFFDRDTIDEEIPYEFGGVNVVMYDVKEVLKEAKGMLGKFTDDDEEDKMALRLFNRTIELCEGFLNGSISQRA